MVVCLFYFGLTFYFQQNSTLFIYLFMYKQDTFSDASKQIKLGFMTGLVPKDKSMAFGRILFRATRGNMYLRQAVVEEPVMDPGSGEKVIF